MTFGPNGTGYITSTFQSQSRFFSIDLQTNGYIVLAGWSFDDDDLANALVAHYTSTGILDTTFLYGDAGCRAYTWRWGRKPIEHVECYCNCEQYAKAHGKCINCGHVNIPKEMKTTTPSA